MSEPTLDKQPLINAVGAELAGHSPHQPFEAVHGATKVAIDAAYGDPKALELFAKLEHDNPELAELIKLAADLAAKHPGFWTGLYAHEHHAAPLPSDHPWARAVAHTFGASDAPPFMHEHHGHHHHAAGYFGAGYHGSRPSRVWHPEEQRWVHDWNAEHIPGGMGQHFDSPGYFHRFDSSGAPPPPSPGRGHSVRHPRAQRHAPGYGQHFDSSGAHFDSPDVFHEWYTGAGHPPPPPPHPGGGARPAPPNFGGRPGAPNFGARPGAPNFGGRPGAPNFGGRGYQAPYYGQQQGPQQQVDDSAIYGGQGGDDGGDGSDFEDYAAHDDEDTDVPPMPATPLSAAPQAVPSVAAATQAPTATPVPAMPMPTTTGADPYHHARHLRRVLRHAMEFFRTAPLPPGVSLAQRNALLAQLFALAQSPTLETAHAVMLQLQSVLSGPEAQAYATQLAALFPAWATGAGPVTQEQELGRRQEMFHPHDPRWQQRELGVEEQERHAGYPYGHPGAPEAYGRPGAPQPWEGRPGAPRPGAPRPGAPEAYGRPGAPRPGAPRPGAPGAPAGHNALNSWQRWKEVHAGQPNNTPGDYAAWWDAYGQHGATIMPDAPAAPFMPFGRLSVNVSGPGRGGGGGGRGGVVRGFGRGGWGGGGYGYLDGWAPYLGPQYVVDQRNELEDVEMPYHGDPEGMGN